jgi:hypothetical protein
MDNVVLLTNTLWHWVLLPLIKTATEMSALFLVVKNLKVQVVLSTVVILLPDNVSKIPLPANVQLSMILNVMMEMDAQLKNV